jgi:hypothetical protein
MDPIRNPYAPGAGSPPPELAGRAEVISDASIAIQRANLGRPTKSIVLVGLRGVGKTVLLNHMKSKAEDVGACTIYIEAHDGKDLPALILPGLRATLYSLSLRESAAELARRGLRVLRSFLSRFQVSVGDLEFGLTVDPEVGSADTGDLENDLPELISAVGMAAKMAGTSLVIFVDELQYLSEKEFSSLIMSIHRTNQNSIPVLLIAAGLPQVLSLAGASKSYTERLFRYPYIGPLSPEDAELAIVSPARDEGVEFSDQSIRKILDVTQRYPYFLQQWAYEAWNASPTAEISADIVDVATRMALKELDESFFRVRFDRCTPTERRYMRALAELGDGTHRSSDVADLLNLKITSAAPIRNNLIKKGMIYSPAYGDTSFTVPLFDQYMRRIIPRLEGYDGSSVA